jgi:hypothetical protein
MQTRVPSPIRRSIALRCALAALLVTGPSLVYGQDASAVSAGRAELLAAERDKKASYVTPPQRSVVERAFYWYDNQYVLAKIFGGWNGLHLASPQR